MGRATCWGETREQNNDTASLEVNTLGPHPQEGGKVDMEKGSLRNGERGKSTALTRKSRDGRILDKLPGGGLSLLLLGGSKLLLVLLKHVLPMPCLL